MFENLDDPVPPTPARLDGVVDRGRSLRVRRRAIAGAVAAFVLAGTIATAAALQGGAQHKVVVANEPSTTTVSETTVPGTTDTTTTNTTDTTTRAPTTTDTTPTTTVAAPVVTTTTQPHDVHDYTMVRVDYGTDIVALPEGAAQLVTYTVTNWGSWGVQIGECVGFTAQVWASPATSGWPPYTEGIWPAPYPAKRTGAVLEPCADILRILPPRGSYTASETVLAGYNDAAGNIMPSPPGFTSFQPFDLRQCSQPCDPHAPNSLAITVEAPTWPPPPSLYTIDVKTMHPQAASGQSAPVEMTYTNGLAFTVRVPIFGPCWKVKSGAATVDCSGKLPAIVIGPHQSVDLVGTLWARAGHTATGAPLPAGKYPIDLGDLQGTAYTPGPSFPNLTVS